MGSDSGTRYKKIKGDDEVGRAVRSWLLLGVWAMGFLKGAAADRTLPPNDDDDEVGLLPLRNFSLSSRAGLVLSLT